MTDSSILQRYLNTGDTKPNEHDELTEPDEANDFKSFGWHRGIRDRALMLELRQKNGNIIALGYSWLERVEFNPSEGITLSFGSEKVQLKGRHLNSETRPQVKLFEGLLRHKVPWVQEADRETHLRSNDTDTLITSIVLQNETS
tara:strand:+ start:1353 stop:1784 length:432 start_codon:yes stop_codon:yes gene_type:complete